LLFLSNFNLSIFSSYIQVYPSVVHSLFMPDPEIVLLKYGRIILKWILRKLYACCFTGLISLVIVFIGRLFEYNNKPLCSINSKQLLNELNDYQRSNRIDLFAVYYKPVRRVRFDYLSICTKLIPLAARSKECVWGLSLAGVAGSNPNVKRGWLALARVVCCPAEVSGSSWSLVQRSPTECACVCVYVCACACLCHCVCVWSGAAVTVYTYSNCLHLQ
jgi:hypothetical protein